MQCYNRGLSYLSYLSYSRLREYKPTPTQKWILIILLPATFLCLWNFFLVIIYASLQLALYCVLGAGGLQALFETDKSKKDNGVSVIDKLKEPEANQKKKPKKANLKGSTFADFLAVSCSLQIPEEKNAESQTFPSSKKKYLVTSEKVLSTPPPPRKYFEKVLSSTPRSSGKYLVTPEKVLSSTPPPPGESKVKRSRRFSGSEEVIDRVKMLPPALLFLVLQFVLSTADLDVIVLQSLLFVLPIKKLAKIIVDYQTGPEFPLTVSKEVYFQGTYGIVRKVTDARDRVYALKRFKEIQKGIPDEYLIMSGLDSHYICPVYHCYQDKVNFGADEPVCIVMPWYPNTLEKRIQLAAKQGSFTQRGIKADEIVILRWLKQLAYGLCAIHSRKITHGDLKPSNILLSDEDDIKIADFGEAGTGTYITGLRGTQKYVAPEIWDSYGKNGHSRKYTQTADMWSLGVILGELLTLNTTSEYLKKYSSFLLNIVARLLNRDRHQRLTSSQLKDMLDKEVD